MVRYFLGIVLAKLISALLLALMELFLCQSEEVAGEIMKKMAS